MDIELFEDVQIIQSEDLKSINQFYNPDLKKNQNQFIKNDNNSNLAILIDYGSYSTKAGWANSKVPDMIFRTVVSKNKDLKNIYHNVQVGNQLKEIDFLKMNYRSPFEKNIVQHFGLLENVNDYIFSNLGIQKERVDHPIVLTECFSNPEYCRLNVVEQFFECYDVPNLTLGVDTLFNYYNQQNKSDDCLQISIGHTMIHVVPMIAGKVQRLDIKRVQVGAQNSFEVLQKNLILKNPLFKNQITMEVINGIHEKYVETAINFQDSLNFTKNGNRAFLNDFYKNSIRYENNKLNSEQINQYLRPILVEFPKKNELIPNQEELERKKQIRKEQGERLKEAILKKREQKFKIFEQELKDLEELQRSQQHDKETFESQLRILGMQKMDQLQKKIRDLKIKLGHIKKEDIEQEKTYLLNIPNDQLTPDQQRLKKIQQFHKQAQEIRQLKKEQDLQKKQEIQAFKDSDPVKYMNALYEKREKYLQKIESKKKQRQELGVRNSKANQRRMQTLAQLGGEQPKLKKGLEKVMQCIKCCIKYGEQFAQFIRKVLQVCV